MREITFRGKRIDNGEWVEGYISEHTMIPHDMNPYIGWVIECKPKEIYEHDWYEVIPETVGQYTGLTDKNGKKVFEHDVTEDAWGRKWIIFACAGGFGIRRNSEWLRNDPIYNALADSQNAAWFKNNHTVIGNIHDNPEMLKR